MAVSDLFYSSSDGDVVDAIVARHYGNTRGGKVEAVIAANQGLAEVGAVLPAGIRIKLPDLDEDQPEETVQLWG